MNTPFFRFSIITLSLFVFVCKTGAQNIDTPNSIDLDEVIVTAQYSPQSIENSVYRIKVISSKEISLAGANNLRELLYHELNIDLEQRSVFGTSIEIQGISKENVKILIDGIPVIGRLNGVIDLTQINLDNIERVEIIEGPTSVFYGTDAMAGTINLITKKKQKKILEGSIGSYFESINAYKLNTRIGLMKGDSKMQFSGGIYKFGGTPLSKMKAEIKNGKVVNKNLEVFRFLIGLIIQNSNIQEISLMVYL